MVPAYCFRDLGPRELHAADDLVSDRRVIRHFAKLVGIERAGLAKKAAIDRDLADVVKVSRAAESGNFARIHAHGIADGGGVSSHAQRMSVNVDVLDVNRGGESFERIIVETVQISHQAQVFGDALRDGLGQCMIVNSECDVAAQQCESIEFAVFIESIAGAPAERDYSGKAASRFQRRETFE